MTAFEINAQVYHNLGLIANNETYMKAVLDLINKFVGEKEAKEATKKNSCKERPAFFVGKICRNLLFVT